MCGRPCVREQHSGSTNTKTLTSGRAVEGMVELGSGERLLWVGVGLPASTKRRTRRGLTWAVREGGNLQLCELAVRVRQYAVGLRPTGHFQ